MVAGAVHKKADYVAGDAWMPQYVGRDTTFKKTGEARIRLWTRAADIRGMPYTWNRSAWLTSVCLDRDGDNFIVTTRNPDNGEPRLQFLEAHRIGMPGGKIFTDLVENGPYEGKRILNGVVYDDYNRPLAYNLLPVTGAMDADNFAFLPAASVIHIFDPRWFSQGRGIPSISYGILDWYDISEIRDSEKIAVKVNSALALVEKNDTGTHDPTPQAIASRSAYWTDKPLKPWVELLEGGTIRYIKTNGSLEAHKADRPSSTFEGFMDHIARGGFVGMDWPIEVALDMSKVGGAAVRAVVNQAQRSVNSRQVAMRHPLESAFLYVVASFIQRGEIPFTEDWWNWIFTYPAKFSVDVGRDRQNVREDLASGVITLTKVVSDGGGDVETHLRERAKDYKLAEEIATDEGVPINVVYNPLSVSPQVPGLSDGQDVVNNQDGQDNQDNQDVEADDGMDAPGGDE